MSAGDEGRGLVSTGVGQEKPQGTSVHLSSGNCKQCHDRRFGGRGDRPARATTSRSHLEHEGAAEKACSRRDRSWFSSDTSQSGQCTVRLKGGAEVVQQEHRACRSSRSFFKDSLGGALTAGSALDASFLCPRAHWDLAGGHWDLGSLSGTGDPWAGDPGGSLLPYPLPWLSPAPGRLREHPEPGFSLPGAMASSPPLPSCLSVLPVVSQRRSSPPLTPTPILLATEYDPPSIRDSYFSLGQPGKCSVNTCSGQGLCHRWFLGRGVGA